jgi:uncharacterized protein YjbI with pentapeptide repeats
MGRRFASLRTPAALLLIVGAAALLVGLAVVLVKLAPEWLTDTQGLSPTERDEARGRTRTALFALLAGVIALVGAVYTARTFALNRRGQLTERFTRAIDQLGNDKLEIRLGGIYALERIALESSDEHGPIAEVITAYVRENSPSQPSGRSNPVGGAPVLEDRIADVVEGLAEGWPVGQAVPEVDRSREAQSEQNDDTPREASVDIKAILTVLSRRDLRHERERPLRLDLSETNLRRVKAREIPLRLANLYTAQLQEADLAEAQLVEANLKEAELQKTNLFGAHLQRADLAHAQLEEANLRGAQLQEADLTGAQLQRANLAGADLREAILNRARLEGAYLSATQLQRAKLNWAQMPGARLLQADLYEAHLGDADLRRARLNGANFGRTQLQGANLNEAEARRANFDGAVTSHSVV